MNLTVFDLQLSLSPLIHLNDEYFRAGEKDRKGYGSHC